MRTKIIGNASKKMNPDLFLTVSFKFLNAIVKNFKEFHQHSPILNSFIIYFNDLAKTGQSMQGIRSLTSSI